MDSTGRKQIKTRYHRSNHLNEERQLSNSKENHQDKIGNFKHCARLTRVTSNFKYNNSSSSISNNNNLYKSHNNDRSHDDATKKHLGATLGLAEMPNTSDCDGDLCCDKSTGSSVKLDPACLHEAGGRHAKREDDKLGGHPVVYSLQQVQHQQRASSSCKRSIGQCSSVSSTRSTCCSSGFASERTQSSRSGRASPFKQFSGPQGDNRVQGKRSRVIEDLDRLMFDINRNSTSPSDSYLSAADSTLKDSTLTRGLEFDYTTLCKDEFSSFIAVEKKRHRRADARSCSPVDQPFEPASECRQSGPVLIGVHESSGECPRTAGLDQLQPDTRSSTSPSSPCSSPSSSDTEQYEIHEMPSSSSSLSCLSTRSSPNDDEQSSVDRELVLLRTDSSDLPSNVSIQSEVDLSKVLDVYLKRVQSLIRLSRGDRSVSMEEAFGGDVEINVRDEHKTELEILPKKREEPKITIFQEIEMINEDGIDENEYEAKREILSRTINKDFSSILWAPQTTAQLDWSQYERCEQGRHCERADLSNRLRQLERSLLDRLSDCDLPIKGQECLVSTVRRHLSEFIENFNVYQNELKDKTEFANDWHQNWLFAYKRPNDDLSGGLACSTSPKRARLSNHGGQFDLIKYSTLILNKCKPVKLTYLNGESKQEEEIDNLYRAQEDQMGELRKVSLENRREIDACKLLLCDQENVEPRELVDKSRACFGEKTVRISYSSSSAFRCNDRCRFSAYGYLFELPVSVSLTSDKSCEKLSRIREKILLKMGNMFCNNTIQMNDFGSNRTGNVNTNGHVKFVVSLTNVELINKLPVVQFCAKISGSLPISVRWFRCDEEVSNVSAFACSRQKRNRFKIKDCAVRGAEWPIEMQAIYDYEYQTEWFSWLRFRRYRDDIIFEIREPDLERDYNQTYRCVVQNCCSQRECTFSLQERKLGFEKASKRATNGASVDGDRRCKDGHALLRTWSQRTLHKPQPSTCDKARQPAHDRDPNQAQAQPKEGLQSQQVEQNLSRSWQLTVGRRSALLTDEDKFGKNFPYHPENLLKRLEENKFSVSLKHKLANKHGPGKQQATCPQLMPQSSGGDFCSKIKCDALAEMQFTDSIELPAERRNGTSNDFIRTKTDDAERGATRGTGAGTHQVS